MSTILIRRGNGVPGNGILSTGELGWDNINNTLFIGLDGLAPIQIVQSTQTFLTVDQVTGDIAASGSIIANALISSTDLTILENTILGDAAVDTLTVNASSTFNNPVTINSTLLASGLTSLNGGIEVDSNFTVNGISGAVYTGSTFDAVGDITTLGDLSAVNLVLSGNLTIQGTTTTINSTVTTIIDPVLTIGETLVVDDGKDRGIEFGYGTTATPLTGYFGYVANSGRFTFIPDSVNTSESFTGNPGDVQFGEIYQTQTAGVYDPVGAVVNASARWNATSDTVGAMNIFLDESPIQLVSDPLTITYNFVYNVNFIQVFLNRLKLRKSEFEAINGTSITISYPLEINDEIEIITASVA